MNDLSQDLGGAEPVKIPDDRIDAILQQRDSAQAGAINQGIDGNPDQAAHAMALEGPSGVPAPLINANYDDFISRQKKIAAQGIVGLNPDLQAYVAAHPLAATVSADDWAALDEFTRANSGSVLRDLHGVLNAPFAPIGEDMLKGLVEGFEGGGVGTSPELDRAMDPAQNRLGVLGSLAAKLVYGGIDLGGRAFGAAGGVVGGAISGTARALGADEPEAQRISQAVMNEGMAESGMHAHAPEAVAKPKSAAEVARPWTESGIEPPTGLHPEIDAAKADLNAQAVERIEDDLKNAVGSETRERSPELFAELTGKLYGDTSISIHSDAVLGLYGDKIPEAEDGILGWVPDIESQLNTAREVGGDINIPLKDWIARVDPALAKELHDDIRVWPGGITAREAEEAKAGAEGQDQPRQYIDEALPQLRGTSGLEPKFSIGDRKLQLQAGAVEAGDQFHPEVHNFDMLDEDGKPVGNMEIIPGPDGKTLYVNWIGGQAGLWANSFGPALVRDLKKQLKAAYPEYEYLTGHRVSGAREGVDNFGPMPLPRVRLDAEAPDDMGNMQRMFEFAYERGGEDVGVTDQGRGIRTANLPAEGSESRAIADKMGSIISAEINRITGGVDIKHTLGIGVGDNVNIGGVYVPDRDKPPTIITSLMSRDPLGAARHEAVHYLRGYGFITEDEWGKLTQAAQDEGWLDRYKIHDRYAHLDDEAKHEEAIAEGFREWAAQAPEVRPKTGVGAVFQKIMDLFDAIKTKLGFGPEATWEDVFAKIHSGEVGERGPGAPREGAFDMRAKLSVEDERKAIIEGLTNLQAQSLGLPKDSFERVREAIRKQGEDDLRVAQARAEREQKRRQTDEWKTNRAEMAKEVSAQIRARPDIAADLFVGSGEMNGVKLQQRYTLRAEDLTPEQRAVLPEHYVSKSGLPVDAVAGLFGYSSRDELVGRLAEVNALKVDAEGKRLPPGEFLRKMVQTETDRRMEVRYGNLAANIADEAKDQALSESSMNVMYEELRAAADAAGVTVPGKAEMQARAAALIGEFSIGKVNTYRLMQEMGRVSRAAEAALIVKDYATAAPLLQRQTLVAMVAAEAKAVEKEVAKADKMFKRMAKREVKSMAPEYTNQVHDIMQRIGKPVRRTPADLAREIQANGMGDTLEDFANHKLQYGQPIDAWQGLLDDPKWSKPYKDMTVEEFRGVRDTVESLIHAGRAEREIIYKGEQADFDELRPKLIEGLKQKEPGEFGVEGPVKPPNFVKKTYPRLIQVEFLMNWLDKYNWQGVWHQTFARPLIEGENSYWKWQRSLAKTFNEIRARPDLSKTIDNPFWRDPWTHKLRPMTQENLRAVMVQMGSDSSFDKLTRGWSIPEVNHKITREMVEGWVKQHATPDDWKFVTSIWKALELPRDESSKAYRRLSGVPMKWVEGRMVDTPDGPVKGGYYPVDFHPYYKGKSAKLSGISPDGLFGEGYSTGHAPSAGYTIARTDYAAPTAMTLDNLVGKINQQLWDAAMREPLTNASKILRDPKIRNEINSRLGTEWHDMMSDYLRTVANKNNISGEVSQWGQQAGAYLRFGISNMISNLVGGAMGTVMKHGPSAAALSINQVGAKQLLRAGKMLFQTNEETGEKWHKFAHENSLVLQARDRTVQEQMFGALQDATGKRTGYMKLREKLQSWGSKPVAMSDLASAYPTWLGAYLHGVEELSMEQGDAVQYADYNVRQAHGSTNVTSKPVITSDLNPAFTTLYTFFSDVFNRTNQTVWQAGDMVGAVRSGDMPEAARLAPKVMGGIFTAYIATALVENLVSPTRRNKDEGEMHYLMRAGTHTAVAGIPIVRDIVEYMIGGDSPQVGMLTQMIESLGSLPKDLAKDRPLSPPHAQKLIRDAAGTLGLGLGGGGHATGAALSYTYGVATGLEHPKGPWSWLVGLRYGTTKGHSETLDDRIHGRVRR
jgi:hypothetical protein